MKLNSIRRSMSRLLHRLATRLDPVAAATTEPHLETLATQAVAWMAYATDPERVAAAALLRRHHPGIAPHMTAAIQKASDFTLHLRHLIALENLRSASESEQDGGEAEA